MELAWVIVLFVSLAGVGNAQVQNQCYECVTMVQGQDAVAMLNLSSSDVRRLLFADLLTNPFTVPEDCTTATYGGETTCPATGTGPTCATESFTINMNHPLAGDFVVEATRRYCSGFEQGCITGADYGAISLFEDPVELNNLILGPLVPGLTFASLVDGSLCTCTGSLCNGAISGATGRETSYAVLLAALLLTVSAKYVF